MHEYSITSSIIDILEGIGEKNSLEKIKKVNFLISPVASIEPGSIRFYYGYLTEDNQLLKDAELVFERSVIKIRCTSCGKVSSVKEFNPLCTGCGSSDVIMQEPDEIKIVSVET